MTAAGDVVDDHARDHDAVRELGAVVIDREDPDPSEAVVVNLPPVPAEEWGAYFADGEDVTVAEDNPGYDPEVEVIVVAFREELDDAHPEYDADEPLALGEADVRTYAFPPGRLERVDDGGDPDPAPDPEEMLIDAQVALRDRLAESAEVRVERDDDEAVLVVEKLGEEHRITPTGEVSGPLAGRLQDLADEYLGGETA